MHAAEQPSSPRGIPAIRTDWLADVAWRLAAHGLDALRGPEWGEATLADRVDGQPWRLEATRLSQPWESVVELDADLYLPSDGTTATMRAGFDLAPGWHDEHGAVTQVRVEIGPRGAVTFDPENWMLTVPVDAPKPAVSGVEPGGWAPRGTGGAAAQPAALDDLTGLDLELLEVPESTEQADREVRLPAEPPRPRRSLLQKLTGGGRRDRYAPVACLVVRAESPITAAADGDPAALDEIDRLSGVTGVRAHHDHVAITAAEGTLVLRGTRLRAEVQRFDRAARA